MLLPSGYARHRASTGDLPAIERLLAGCDAVEPEPGYGDLVGPIRGVVEDDAVRGTGEALAITDASGEVIACASFRLPDYPRPIAFARLHGAVHPHHRRRGIGSYLLDWTERRAHTLFGARRESRPRSLRISFGGSRDDAERLYRRRGFDFLDRTLQLRRDLAAPIVEPPLPSGVSTTAWSQQTGPLFYAAYNASHVTTPEARTRTEEEWCADVAADATLRSDLSLVALDTRAEPRSHPCAFILAEVVPRDGRDVGWIWLLAVDPGYRRRGIATALLSHALGAFRREGFPEAGLWVDEANAAARAVYDRLGFRRRGRETTYAKAPRTDVT